MAGRLTMARAMQSLCCSPPERVIGLAFSRPSRPTLSSAARERRAISPRGKPVIASGSATFSNTLRSKSSLWSWKMSPKLRRR